MSWRFTPKKLAKEIDESASVVVSPAPRGGAEGRHRAACLGASHQRSSRRRLTSRRQLSLVLPRVVEQKEGTEQRVLELHTKEAREGD